MEELPEGHIGADGAAESHSSEMQQAGEAAGGNVSDGGAAAARHPGMQKPQEAAGGDVSYEKADNGGSGS